MLGTVLIFVALGLAAAVIFIGDRRYRREFMAIWFMIAAVTMALIFH